MSSRTAPEIERYFTEQVVGQPFMLTMGPSQGVQHHARHGVVIEHLARAGQLSRTAALTLGTPDAAGVLMGQPVSLPQLRRWRWGLAASVLALWGVGVAVATWYVLTA